MNFKYTDGQNQDFIILCHELDAFLNDLVGGEENRSEYIPYNTLDDIHDVIVAYDGDIPAGCISFKRYDSQNAEIKRFFVRENYRSDGLGRKLMELLETSAKKQAYHYLILESGDPLVVAMKLYRSMDYKVIPNYGPYADMPDSVCMRKVL